MEGWKKGYIWIVAVFLLTAVAGKVIMARTPDVGLAGVKTIDELSGRQVKLEYALGDGESREALVESLTKNQDEYVRQAEDADIIVYCVRGNVSGSNFYGEVPWKLEKAVLRAALCSIAGASSGVQVL